MEYRDRLTGWPFAIFWISILSGCVGVWIAFAWGLGELVNVLGELVEWME